MPRELTKKLLGLQKADYSEWWVNWPSMRANKVLESVDELSANFKPWHARPSTSGSNRGEERLFDRESTSSTSLLFISKG
jgi:hypothetical protein